MKLTKLKLEQLIKEELENMDEGFFQTMRDWYRRLEDWAVGEDEGSMVDAVHGEVRKAEKVGDWGKAVAMAQHLNKKHPSPENEKLVNTVSNYANPRTQPFRMKKYGKDKRRSDPFDPHAPQ